MELHWIHMGELSWKVLSQQIEVPSMGIRARNASSLVREFGFRLGSRRKRTTFGVG